jgi:hypothetical protein
MESLCLQTSLAVIDEKLFAGTTGGGVWMLPISFLTGKEELFEKKINISLYPNPMGERITIEVQKQLLKQKIDLSIYNLQGQKLLQRTVYQEITELDLSALANGFYLLRVQIDSKVEVLRFLKE